MLVKEREYKLAGLKRKHYIAISAFVLVVVITIVFFIGYYRVNETGEYEGTLVYNSRDISGGPGEMDG